MICRLHHWKPPFPVMWKAAGRLGRTSPAAAFTGPDAVLAGAGLPRRDLSRPRPWHEALRARGGRTLTLTGTTQSGWGWGLGVWGNAVPDYSPAVLHDLSFAMAALISGIGTGRSAVRIAVRHLMASSSFSFVLCIRHPIV